MKNFSNEIILGDCLSVLKDIPDCTIDLAITSPPYNKGEKQKGWLVKNVLYDNISDNMEESLYQQQQIDVLNEAYRTIKEGGHFFYNHKIRWIQGKLIHPLEWLLKTKWTLRQEIIWDRSIAANIRGWRFWQVDERIYWLYKPIKNKLIGKELESKHALLTSIWRFPPERNNIHPAPFPLELPTRIISSILNNEDGLVLDPYSGSGTTLIAAKLLGKKFLGIDVSKQYIDFTKNRLQDASKEQNKAEEELSKHHVRKTFKSRKLEGLNTGKFQGNHVSRKQKELF